MEGTNNIKQCECGKHIPKHAAACVYCSEPGTAWQPIDTAPKDRPILWRSHAHKAPDVIKWDDRLGEWWSYRLGFLIQVLGEWCEVPK